MKNFTYQYIKYYFLFFFVQIFNHNVTAQEITISGRIIDITNNEPIEFVNIGVINKNKGTVSNLNGEFSITVPKDFENDSLTISHINYITHKIKIENKHDKNIYLEPVENILSEVVILNKRKRNRKIGVKAYNRLISMRVISKNNDIVEVAQRINIPNKEVLITAVNFNLRKWSKVDGAYVRINFYQNIENVPGDRIVLKNIVQKIKMQPNSGWVQVDLKDYDIYTSEDFFVGIEFIPNFKNPTIIDLGSILSKGKGYSRKNSLGSWNKLNGGASINVEIEF